MTRIIRLIATGVLLSLTSNSVLAQTAPAPEHRQTDDASKRVRVLVREAAAAMKLAKYEEAREMLFEAWRLRPASDVAMLLAQVEMELKQYRDAAEHLDYAIANFAAVESDKLLGTLQQAFAEAKTHVGQLRINTNREGAEVRIDNHLVGVSPTTAVVYVDPGTHTIEARSGNDTVGQQIVVEAGQEYAVPLTLTSAQSGPVSTAAPNAPIEPHEPASPSDTDGHRSIVPVIVGGAMFALGVGTAIGFKLDETAKRDTAETLRATIGAQGCVNPLLHPNECQSLVDTSKRVDRDRTWVGIGLVAAGVAAVATPLYWFWPRSKHDTAANLSSARLTTGVGPEGAVLLLSGGF